VSSQPVGIATPGRERAPWLHAVGGDFDALDADGVECGDRETGPWLLGGHLDLEPVRAATRSGMSWHDIGSIALGIVERRWPEIDP
jgi:hypothetical protein